MYVPENPIKNWRLVLHEGSQQDKKALESWNKNLRVNAKDFPTFKDGIFWTRYRRKLLATVKSFGLDHLLDPTHKPENPKLDEAQQDWLYKVMQDTFTEPFAKKTVNKHYLDKDTRAIWLEVEEYHDSSMTTQIRIGAISNYITGTRLATSGYRGSYSGFIINFIEQIRTYNEMVQDPIDQFSDGMAIMFLEASLQGIESLSTVKTVWMAAQKAAGNTGANLNLDEYTRLLLLRAETHDAPKRNSRNKYVSNAHSTEYIFDDDDQDQDIDGPSALQADVHDIDMDADIEYMIQHNEQSSKPFNGRPRRAWMDKSSWQSLPDEDRKIWDSLSDGAKGTIKAAYSKPEQGRPFSQNRRTSARVHESGTSEQPQEGKVNDDMEPKIEATTHERSSLVDKPDPTDSKCNDIDLLALATQRTPIKQLERDTMKKVDVNINQILSEPRKNPTKKTKTIRTIGIPYELQRETDFHEVDMSKRSEHTPNMFNTWVLESNMHETDMHNRPTGSIQDPHEESEQAQVGTEASVPPEDTEQGQEQDEEQSTIQEINTEDLGQHNEDEPLDYEGIVALMTDEELARLAKVASDRLTPRSSGTNQDVDTQPIHTSTSHAQSQVPTQETASSRPDLNVQATSQFGSPLPTNVVPLSSLGGTMGSACVGQTMDVVPYTPSKGETTDTTRDTSFSFYGSSIPDAVASLSPSQGETSHVAATSLSRQEGETTRLAQLKEETSSQEIGNEVIPPYERPEDVLTKAQIEENNLINSMMALVNKDEVDPPPPPSSDEATVTTSPSRLHEETFADTVYSTNDEHKQVSFRELESKYHDVFETDKPTVAGSIVGRIFSRNPNPAPYRYHGQQQSRSTTTTDPREVQNRLVAPRTMTRDARMMSRNHHTNHNYGLLSHKPTSGSIGGDQHIGANTKTVAESIMDRSIYKRPSRGVAPGHYDPTVPKQRYIREGQGDNVTWDPEVSSTDRTGHDPKEQGSSKKPTNAADITKLFRNRLKKGPPRALNLKPAPPTEVVEGSTQMEDINKMLGGMTFKDHKKLSSPKVGTEIHGNSDFTGPMIIRNTKYGNLPATSYPGRSPNGKSEPQYPKGETEVINNLVPKDIVLKNTIPQGRPVGTSIVPYASRTLTTSTGTSGTPRDTSMLKDSELTDHELAKRISNRAGRARKKKSKKDDKDKKMPATTPTNQATNDIGILGRVTGRVCNMMSPTGYHNTAVSDESSSVAHSSSTDSPGSNNGTGSSDSRSNGSPSGGTDSQSGGGSPDKEADFQEGDP